MIAEGLGKGWFFAVMSEKRKKIRVDLRKNRGNAPRSKNWDHDLASDSSELPHERACKAERVRPKGDISRKRTLVVSENADTSVAMPEIDKDVCLPGRVLRVHGLLSVVETEDGRIFRCTIRRLLKTLAIDSRSMITCGDRVWICPEAQQTNRSSDTSSSLSGRPPLPGEASGEATIERVEPRTGQLMRSSRNKVHAIVSNVDQAVFVLSLKEPDLKIHLIDRYLASAIQGSIKPIVCLNKADLVDPAEYQHVIGLYSRIGVETFMASTRNGWGIVELRDLLKGKQTVFSGQSGVGKSSLLNSIQPGLGLRVKEVSESNSKGRHTTTTSELIRLNEGGWVVDTPGIRQFELSGVRPEEIEAFFPEFHPFIALCKFPGCTHVHEGGCAVMGAVVRRQLALSRYTSYKGLLGVDNPEIDEDSM